MAVKVVEWSAGVAVAGSIAQPGTYTTQIQNFVLNEQKNPEFRFASEFLATYSIDGTYLRSYYSIMRKKIYIATLASDTVTVTVQIIDPNTNTITSTSQESTGSPIEAVFMTEIDSFMITKNVVEGVSAVVISGMDFLYYLDDADTFKPFLIVTDAVAAGTNVISPIDTTFFQSRLAIACLGPNLTTENPPSSPNRVLFSRSGRADDFTTTGTTYPSAIDAIILTLAGTQTYALSTVTNMVAVVSSFGLSVIRSGDSTDEVLTNTNIVSSVSSYSNTIRVKPTLFAGFIIYAAPYFMRAKQVAALSQDNTNNLDLELPLLNVFESEIVDISYDNNGQLLVIFLKNGDTWAMSSQTIYPTKGYTLSLPLTQNYTSKYLFYRAVLATDPKYVIVSYDQNYVVLQQPLIDNNYGFLLTGCTPYDWAITINNVVGNSFDATFTEFSWTSAGTIVGMWLKVGAYYYFYATDTDHYPTFTTSVDGVVLEEGTNTSCLLVIAPQDAFNYLITPFNNEYSVFETIFNLVGVDDQMEYEMDHFSASPINSIGYIPGLPTNQAYTGTIQYYAAMEGDTGLIGWRDSDAITTLQNVGSTEGTLLSPQEDLIDFVEFYTDNSAVHSTTFRDCTQVVFRTDSGQSYATRTIKMRAKQFLQSDGRKYINRLFEAV